MRLNQFTDYGLRVLMYLAKHERESLVTITELSEQFNVSRNHLVKVVNHLVKLEWVDATRGRNGGLKLGTPASKLHVGEMIRRLEDHETLIDCEKAVCSLDGQCRLQGMLASGLNQFYSYMDQFTLADMVDKPTGDIIVQMHRRWVA